MHNKLFSRIFAFAAAWRAIQRTGFLRVAACAVLPLALQPTAAGAGPLEDLQPGHWYEVPGSTLAAVNPCPSDNCSYSGIEGQTGVIDDWNGGVLATRYGAMGGFVVWGGGHNGYRGNEVYVFDIAALRWRRVSEPVQNPSCNQSESELQDGSPCSPHNYDYLSYHPGTNSMVKLGSSSNDMMGGGGSGRVHLFNFDTNQWRRGAVKPTVRLSVSEGASSAYDPSRDVFWLLSAFNQRFAKYDPNGSSGAGLWTEYNTFNVEIYSVGAIDPVRDLFVSVEGAFNHAVYVFDLKNPSAGGTRVTTGGDRTIENTQAAGFEWDPISQAFIGWAGGTSVYKLTPPAGDWRTGTWQWSRIAAASGNSVDPGAAHERGTYGRWQYVPSVNGFVVVNRTDANVFFYKLNNAAPIVDPTINFAADATLVPNGGGTTLRWSAANADSCTASNAWTGNKATSGTQAVGPFAVAATFTLNCTNSGGGSASRSVIVNVIPPAPTVAISANPTAVAAGATTTLTWSSSGATTCAAADGDASWTGSKALNSTAVVGPLTAQTTYTLNCTNAGGTTTASVAVTLSTAPPPVGDPVVTLTADATAVAANATTTLRWNATNATACTASNGWTGAKSVAGSQSVGPIAATTTYTLGCTNAGGNTIAANVVVTVVPAPTVTLTASPMTVASGAQSRLTWTSSNATACTAMAGDASWTGAKTVNNNQLVGPVMSATTYSLTCVGTGGSSSASASVFVGAPAQPSITFTATPSAIDPGGFADLVWSSVNATSCMATGSWTGSVAVSGNARVSGLQSTQVYVLTCSGGSGSTSRQVTVTVGSTPPPVAVATTPKESESGFGAANSTYLVLLGLLLLLRKASRKLNAQLANSRKGACVQAGIFSAIVSGLFSLTASAAVDATSVTVVSTSGSAQTNVPVTVGQVFKVGEVPAGSTVTAAMIGTGAVVPIQVDAKATHADGSLRHAVITLKLATLNGNATDQVMLSSAASGGAAGSPVTVAQLLATTFDAQIDLNVGGTNYSASARTLLQAGTPPVWLSGPLVSEWLVSGPVRTSGGAGHAHLTAYFHVRAYSNGSGGVGSVRVDCVVENGWTLVSGAGSFAYTPTISVGGATVFSSAQITHHHHARWHKQFWWPSAPAANAKLDTAYLRATKAIPNYGSTTITDAYLSGLLQTATPMGHGDMNEYMPDSGAQAGIGPLPRWDAVYVTSNADPRAMRNVFANHDSAGSYPTHFRDEATGRPVSIADRPTLSLQVPADFPQTSGANNLNYPDAAHQPSIGFLAYLISGDYYYLEELLFWNSWNQLWMNADYRQGNKGIVYSEVRAQSWMLRNLGQAAYVAPDNHPYKTHLRTSIDNNMAVYDARYSANPSANALGAIQYYADNTINAMWQDDFITWTMAYLVDLQFTSATAFRDWKFKFVVGRNGTTDYCYKHAAFYTGKVGPSAETFYPTFKAMYDANAADGKFTSDTTCAAGGTLLSSGYPAEPDGYFADMTPTLAVAVEAGYAGASAAWARLKGGTPQPNFTNSPNWNVVPRVDPGSSAPTVSLTTNTSTVASGGNATLNWSSTNATSCVATGGWSGAKSLTGTQQITNITQTTSYTLSCSGSGGPTAQQTVQVAVSAPATAVLTASATTVQTGSPVTLTWGSTNATSCTASGGWTGSKAISGSQIITNLTQTVSFMLTCSGAGGSSAPQTVQVVVTAAPPPPPPPVPPATVALGASVLTVVAGNSITLNWSSTNAINCAASGSWSGSRPVNGSEAMMLTQTSTFVLTCTNSAGVAAQTQVQVAVTPPPPPPTATGSSSPEDSGGGAMECGWLAILASVALLRARRRGYLKIRLMPLSA